MLKLDMKTPNFTDENIAKIADIFPNCVTETQDEKGNLIRGIDFDLLRQELSANIVEGQKERYQINWPGKREALVKANEPINKTLRPCREESVNFDTTQNLYIEGDNLEALKLLQESYLGKIKMIYIDPPYNTGNDFIYRDKFVANLDEYNQQIDYSDNEGNKLIAEEQYKRNLQSNGRFHSDWLNMIYPRLKLSRNLLTDDGVIFISIGVEELTNLKAVANEIFGEDNFIEIFSWVKTSTPPALSTKSRKTNEYILCYEKNRSSIKYNGELLDGGDQPLLNTGNSVRALNFPKEKVYFKEDKFPNSILTKGKPDKVELIQDIEIINGYSTTDFTLVGEFKWTQEFLNEEIKNGTTFIIKSEKLSIRFIRNEEGFKRPTNFIKEKYTTPLINKPNNDVGTNENASSELINLMGGDYFDYPKPVSLIQYLVNFICKENDIVLDFFAGSGTTAEAIYRYNMHNLTHLRYILVQLPEIINETLASDVAERKKIKSTIDFLISIGKPTNIAELSKERIRRVQKNLSQERKNQSFDFGFRVLKIDSSNMKDIYYSPDQMSQSLLTGLVDHIKEDRTPEDLLFQVLIDWGVDLMLPIVREKILGKTVFFVDGDTLAACFDEGIDEPFVKELAKREVMRVVFKETGFARDDIKDNVEQIFKELSPDTEVRAI